MQENDIDDKAHALVELMEKHLGTRGKRLDKALRGAGRLLPRRLRAKVQMLIEAQQMASHPKLRRRIDYDALNAAFTEVAAYLKEIDLAEARKTRVLNFAAGLAFNVLLIAVLFAFFARWRGLI